MPKKDYDYLKKKLSVHPKSIAALEKEVKHDILAFTQSMEAQGGKQARFFHYGLTSSDVLDTAFALQLREASILIVTELKKSPLLSRKVSQKDQIHFSYRQIPWHAWRASLLWPSLCLHVWRT